MTPEQKRRRIQEIERDVQHIMAQLHHIEFKVDTGLVRREEMPIPKLPKMKMPSIFKSLWTGFKQEMKKAP